MDRPIPGKGTGKRCSISVSKKGSFVAVSRKRLSIRARLRACLHFCTLRLAADVVGGYRESTACAFDQNPSHGCRSRKEMTLVIPIVAAVTDHESQIRLMHKCRLKLPSDQRD